MQFIDQARIAVRAGRGGDGISAFRREKYVPAGGPSGGDGGRGGDVVLEADSNLQTLLDFKYKRLFEASDGRRGGPNKSTGASADDLVIRVPCGTEVRNLDSGLLLGDLIDPDALMSLKAPMAPEAPKTLMGPAAFCVVSTFLFLCFFLFCFLWFLGFFGGF